MKILAHFVDALCVQEMNWDGDSTEKLVLPAGMNAKVIKTKKSIVLAQSDTVVFNNTHGARGEFSVNCFEAIILIKRCRDQKE